MLSQKPRKTIRYVDQNSWGHRESPFSHLSFATNEVEADEVVHSSSWLWQSLKARAFKPRFAVGFPEEWNALRAHKEFSFEVLSQIALDLWVFKDLSEDEVLHLSDLLLRSSDSRMIVGANHLMSWRDLAMAPWAQELEKTGQAFLSFLPSQGQHDPFLRPQEVLWELEKGSLPLPILLHDFPISKSGFYNSLSKEVYAQELLAKNPLLISFLKTLNRLDLTSQVLSIQSLISFYLDSRFYKLVHAARYMLDLSFVGRHIRRLLALLLVARNIFFALMRFLLFPLRKVYWFFEYQFNKRLRWGIRK